MSRSRLRNLLAASNLAERDLERERIRAARDSANFKSGVDAVRGLVPAAGELFGMYEKHVGDDVALDGAAVLNENLTATGDEDETPEEMASRLVRARSAFAEPESDGKPRSILRDFVDDPLGVQGRARKSAAVGAQGALAKQIQGNRLAANNLTREDEETEAKRAHELAMQNARNEGKRTKASAADAIEVDDPERADRMARALDKVSESVKSDTSLSKGATEADRREERRLQILARIAADPKKRGVLDEDAWQDLEEAFGMKRPLPGAGPKVPTDKQRKDKALADAAEARARSAAVKARNDENPTQKPPDTKEKGKQRQIVAAKHLLDEIERTHKEYKASTSGPATGRGVGLVRGAFTGILPGMEESKRAKFLANSEGLNAMLFPILGREDAPADAETKRLAPLRIDENTTDDELAAKLATLRGMIEAQSHALSMGAAANPSTDDRASRRRTRIGELRAAGVSKEQARAILAQEGLLQ